MKLVREGHERAFDAIVQRYRRPLLRYCRRIGLSDARAEDVLQLALLNAWLALASGAEVRDLRPWLYRIAHNGALNALRRPAELHVELSDAVPCTMVAEDELDLRIAVCDAFADVAALPPMQRQAVYLTAFAGRTHDEAAGALGVNQDAVRGLLYRARATLRSAAALTPQPLVGWAAGGSGTSGPATERLGELSAGGGALGLTGALVKGAAVAITAGALLGGAAVVRTHGAHHSHGSGSRPVVSGVASLRGDRASTAAGGVAASRPTASETDASPQWADRGPRTGAHVLRRGRRPSSADRRRTPSYRGALQPRSALTGPDAERHGNVAPPNAREGIQRAEESEGVTAPGERGDARGAGSSGSSGDQRTSGSPTSPAREGGSSDRGGSGADGSGPSRSPAWEAPGRSPHEAGHAGSGSASDASEARLGTG